MANCEQSTVMLGGCDYPSIVDNLDGTHTFDPGNGELVVFPTRYLAASLFDNTTRLLRLTMSDGTVYSVEIPCCPTIEDNNDGTYTVTDNLGNTFIIDTNGIVTTLTNNNNGTYTYRNEQNTAVTFKAGWTTLRNTDTEDGSFALVYPDGTEQTLDICGEIAGCTLLTLTDGVTTQTIYPGDSLSLLSTGTVGITLAPNGVFTANANISTDADNGLSTGTDGGLYVAVDTVTTLTYDSATGTFTYTSEDGTITTVLIRHDVANTSTVNMSRTGTGTVLDPYVISSVVRVSPDNENDLEIRNNGLYIDTSPSGDANNLINEGTDGKHYLTCADIENCYPTVVSNIVLNEDGDGYIVSYTDGTTADLDCCAVPAPTPDTIVAEFSPLSSTGTEPVTVNFVDESAGTCAPISWIWYLRETGTIPWTQFSTDENPTQSFVSAGSYDIRLVVECASGASDSVIHTAAVVVTSVEIMPACAGNQTCYKQLNNTAAIRLKAPTYNEAIVSAPGGQTFTNTDGVDVTYQVTGATNSHNSSSGTFYVDTLPGQPVTVSIDVSPSACISGSLGDLSSEIEAVFNTTVTGNISPSNNNPIITNNNTNSVTATGGCLACFDRVLYSTNASSTSISWVITNNSTTARTIPFSLYTNPTCVNNYWAYCDTTGVYTNIHNHNQTTTSLGDYFSELDCADVPATP